MIDTSCLRRKILDTLLNPESLKKSCSSKENKLGDVLKIERGGSPRPIKSYLTTSDDGINWIKIGDTKPGSKYIEAVKEKIKPEGLKKSRFVREGDFLLSNSMSFGRPYILKVDGCIHDGWLVLKDRNSIFDKNFLYYYLSSPRLYAEFAIKAGGSTVENLNIDLVSSVDIIIPPLEEQKRIVTKIEELFAKIDEIDKAQKELKELAELAEKKVLDMAVRGELSYARPGDSNVDDMLSVLRNKKEVGIRNGSIKLEKPYNTSREFELKPFEIPSYWRFERLGSISINLDNFRIPLKNQERQKMNNKHFPYYGASGIIDKVDDYLFDKKLLLVSEDGANLLSRSSPIAFTASGKYWVNNHAHVLDTTEEIDKDYLCCYLESISIAPYVTGSAQPKITQTNLNAIWVPVPPIEEQSRIATTVSLFRAQFSTINS